MREVGLKIYPAAEVGYEATLPLNSNGKKAADIGKATLLNDSAQREMRDALGFIINHGVSIDFALGVFELPRQDFWTPTLEELVAGGVVGR